MINKKNPGLWHSLHVQQTCMEVCDFTGFKKQEKQGRKSPTKFHQLTSKKIGVKLQSETRFPIQNFAENPNIDSMLTAQPQRL